MSEQGKQQQSECSQEPSLSVYRDKATRLTKLEGWFRKAFPTDKDRDDTEALLSYLDTLTTECKRLDGEVGRLKEDACKIYGANGEVKMVMKTPELAISLRKKYAVQIEKSLVELEKAESDLAYYHSIEYAAKLQAQMEPIVKERDGYREALESIEKDDYLWPDHREGSEYTPAQFAYDVVAGKARLWSDEQSLKDHKTVKLQPGEEDGRD